MRAFITGATGFVGGHLLPLLRERASSIDVLLRDDVSEQPPDGVRASVADLFDRDELQAVLSRVAPTHVFHLAGASSVAESFRNPDQAWRVNAEGTRSLLSAVVHAAPAARVIVALSGDQYGRVRPEQLPVTEETPFSPLSPYAESKVAAENFCLEFRRAHGLRVIRLRAFNQIGPGQDLRFVLPSICKQIADAEAAGFERCVIRVGDTSVRRDFVDVRDAARAYVLLSGSGDPDRVYLACSGHSLAVGTLIDFAIAHARIPIVLEVDPSRRREGEQPDLYADPSSLNVLGWEARIPPEQSVLDTLNYWRARAHVEVD